MMFQGKASGVRWRRAVRYGTAVVLLGALGLSDTASAEPQPRPDEPSRAPAAHTHQITGNEEHRPTEADALTTAGRTGRPVEIAAFRGERREVYANPDGTLTAREHTQPVRTVHSGRWVPVDTTLVRRGDGSVAPRAAVVDLRLSGGGDGPLVEAGRAGRQMSLRWPGRLPTPTVEGSRASYADVLPGVDLVVNVTAGGFSHVLVVKSAEAARNQRLAEVEFGLGTTGLDVRAAGDGGLTAVDRATGSAVFESGEPTMWDSGAADAAARNGATGGAGTVDSTDPLRAAPDSARVAKLGVRVGDGRLTLRPDRAMLTDPATRWPVYLDPVWESTSNSAWAMVDSGYPNEEYWKFDGRRDERIGRCPTHEGTCNNSKIKRLFYLLPTPYAGREIISAEFRVTMMHSYDNSARGVSLFRTGGISSATNWNNQPGGAGWSGATHLHSISPTGRQSGCTATNQNVGFNATVGVREAATHGWSAVTFGIKADNESDYHWVKRFCDNAVLSVNFNRVPHRPSVSELTMSPGGACVSGSARPYVDAPPQLNAVLHDPDHSSAHAEQVLAQFRVFWPADSPSVSRTYDTPLKVSGSRFTITAPADLPENVPIGWEVRAGDGRAWSAWSSSGQARCEFVFDKTQPSAPDIDSPEYLPGDAGETTYVCAGDDEVWRDSVGRYGTFTFDSAATDVREYWYGFNENPSAGRKLTPAALGGPVSLRWMPEHDGPNFVTVQAVDQANKKSPIAICHFRVATSPPAADWSLGDAAGSTSAADGRGRSPASAGAGVTFGTPGPGGAGDPAVRLTGAPDSYLVTDRGGVVDTGAGFAVSAWVYLADTTKDAVAVSQSGSGEPGFTLGFDAASGRWEFELPSSDFTSLGGWRVLGTTAVANKWTHLVAGYDAEQRSIALYVDGGAPTQAQRRSAWKARGTVQLGRKQTKWGYAEQWAGGLADVLLFNRVIVAREVTELGRLVPQRRGYWPLNQAPDGLSPEYTGGPELALAGGATLYRFDPEQDPLGQPALVGTGHLVLDGTESHAATPAAVANTDASFTVSVRVRLAGNGCGRDMAAVSQAGTNASGFVIRCSATNRWQAVLPRADADGPVDLVTDDQVLPDAAASGTHLALVYNAVTNEARLYVNGQLADSARVQHTSAWRAGGALQVGRALSGGTWGQYFGGVVDDVRVYDGVADAGTIQRLALPTEQTDL